MNTEIDTFVRQGDRCPLCQSGALRSRIVLAHDSATPCTMAVLHCSACDLAWQWPPARDAEESRRFFQASYAEGQEGTYFDKSVKREIASLELEFLDVVRPAKGTLLDVGSGDGTLAELAFKDGWSVDAVDPAGPLRDETSAGGWLRLRNGTLADIDQNARFDAITLWDVIEHVEKPLDLIADCRHRLGPGGWLVIETGNFGSTARVTGGRTWWGFQLDHRWYFNPATLERLLRQAGFDEFRLCGRMLRPWGVTDGGYGGPSALLHLIAALRSPWRIPGILGDYRDLVSLGRRYPKTAGLEIFALAARIGSRECAGG